MKKQFSLICLMLVLALALTGAVACTPETGGGEQLTAPVITLLGNVVSWQAVPHADSYEIKVGTDAPVSVTGTSYTVSKTAVGDYEVTVVAKSSNSAYKTSEVSNKLTYTVLPVTLERITFTVPQKTDYYLDEQATTLDLTGMTVKAVYTDGTDKTLTANDYTVGQYDLSATGEKEIEISYTENELERKVTLTVEVKERTAAEMENLTASVFEQKSETLKYLLSETAVTKTVDMKGKTVNLVFEENKGYIDKSDLSSGHNYFAVTDENGVRFVDVVLASFVRTVNDWRAMADNLNGYYVLQNDLVFEGWQDIQIGRAPVRQGDDGKELDETGAGDEDLQKGIPFTGTFDGNGYTISDYKRGMNAGPTDLTSYTYGLFGYIGQGGTVGNFNLRNIFIRSGQDCALIAPLNYGTIKNVSIESDCYVASWFGRAGIITNINKGVIENAVSYTDTFGKRVSGATEPDSESNWTSVQGNLVYSGTAAANGYIKPTENLSATLGGMWKYHEKVGNVYANDTYVKITTKNLLLPLGGELCLDIAYFDGDSVASVLYGAKSGELEVTWKNGKHYLTFKDFATSTLALGDTVDVVAKTGAWLGQHKITVTVAAAVITNYEQITETISLKEGLEIDTVFEQILFKAIYSDGTRQDVHPIRAEGFDLSGEIGAAQTVKFFYGAEDDDFFEVAVTLVKKEVVSLELISAPEKTTYTLNETISTIGGEIKIIYDNQTDEKAAITSEMLIASSFDMSVNGTYNVQVEVGGKTCTFKIIVSESELASVQLVGTPAVNQFKLNGEIKESDLAGMTLTASFADGTTLSEIQITEGMLSYDFTSLGAKKVVVTYAGKTAEFDVTVIDYATELAVRATQTKVTYDKDNLPDFSEICGFEVTTASGQKQTLNYSDITVGEVVPGHKEVTFSYTDLSGTKVEAKVTFDLWYKINEVSEWSMLNTYYDGYFMLAKDLLFENSGTMIGRAPFIPDRKIDVTGNGSSEEGGQTGLAFTGKFDGCGYVISDFKLYNDAVRTVASYGTALFGYIGEGAEVGNFTLRNFNIYGGKYTGFVAGLNKGNIHDVCVEANCVMFSFYKNGAVASSYNYGTVSDVVSYVSQFSCSENYSGGIGDLKIVDGETGYTEAVTACYMGNTTDLVSVLGDGWKYFENYGTALVNAYYVNVGSKERNIPLGGRLDVVILRGGETDPVVYAWGAGLNNVNLGWDGEKGHHFITFTDYTGISVGTEINVGIKVAGGSYFILTVKVGEAIPVSAVMVTKNIAVIQGMPIDLSSVEIKVTMSSGEEKSVHPTDVMGDTSSAGTKLVTFVYEEAGVTVKVEAEITVNEDVSSDPMPASLEVVAKKQNIYVPYSEGDWRFSNITKAMWPDFVTVKADNFALSDLSRITVTFLGDTLYGQNKEFTFTYNYKGQSVANTVTLNVYYGITDAAEWFAMENNLDASYALLNDVDFAAVEAANFLSVANATADTNGYVTSFFSGTLNGNGYALRNLTAGDVNSSRVGFFGGIGAAATVKNLALSDIHITAKKLSGILSSCNLGTVENIVMTNCSMTAASKDCSLLVHDNGGNTSANKSAAIIRNVVMKDSFIAVTKAGVTTAYWLSYYSDYMKQNATVTGVYYANITLGSSSAATELAAAYKHKATAVTATVANEFEYAEIAADTVFEGFDPAVWNTSAGAANLKQDVLGLKEGL